MLAFVSSMLFFFVGILVGTAIPEDNLTTFNKRTHDPLVAGILKQGAVSVVLKDQISTIICGGDFIKIYRCKILGAKCDLCP